LRRKHAVALGRVASRRARGDNMSDRCDAAHAGSAA
jgi:hypothetical protein